MHTPHALYGWSVCTTTSIAPDAGDLTRYHSPAYKRMFYAELPQAMHALTVDQSPAAQIRASVTYNMIVEGVLAETGYEAYFATLSRNNLLPGLCHGITFYDVMPFGLQLDEFANIAITNFGRRMRHIEKTQF